MEVAVVLHLLVDPAREEEDDGELCQDYDPGSTREVPPFKETYGRSALYGLLNRNEGNNQEYGQDVTVLRENTTFACSSRCEYDYVQS